MQNLEIFSTPWIVAICAVSFAGFIRGISGFGFGLILVPILLIILQPTAVVITVLALTLINSIFVVAYSFRKIDFKRMFPLSGSSLLGIPLGIWIISIIAPNIMKISIGILIIVIAITLAKGFQKSFKSEKLSSGLAGFLSGMFASSAGLAGPPVVLFMHNQNWSKEVIHPSLSAHFVFISSCSLVVLYLVGLMDLEIIPAATSMAPAMLIGVYLGMKVFHRINTRFFRNISIAIVICTGILGIVSGLGIFT